MEGKREEKMEWSKPMLIKLSQENVAHGGKPCRAGSQPSGACGPGVGVV